MSGLPWFIAILASPVVAVALAAVAARWDR